ASTLPIVTLSALAWALLTGLAWASASGKPVRVKGERELERFIARVPTFDDERQIGEKLAPLWQSAAGIELRALWWRDGTALTNAERMQWQVEPDVYAWLVQHSGPLAVVDLATMRLGRMRAKIEELAVAHEADLVVPLVDRDELVGLVEASCATALRESERGL